MRYHEVRQLRDEPALNPNQIAHELGQHSGEDLVRDVYGGAPPQWDGLLNEKGWVPASGPPAWEPFAAPANVVQVQQSSRVS
jgi:hypothetical protein